MLDVVAEGGEEEGEALLAAEAVEEAAVLGEAEDGLLGGIRASRRVVYTLE